MTAECTSCGLTTPADGAFCKHCGARLDPHATVAHIALEADPVMNQETVPDLPAPAQIGGYRILRRLGAGGMGSVYEAEADESGQRVALKLLSTRLASNPISVERFRQEGRLASQISHPHCVFVIRADADAGQPFIVMELMPGLTLKDVVEKQGPLSPKEAVGRILDVVDGLIEAHRLGLIHRDVKPSNCFLTADDRVKVGDFGLSKSLVDSEADGQLTGTGAFLGTVLYAPPEQIRGEEVGYDSDVYSVCATLYYLLAGKAPYQHESMTAALAKAISEAPPSLRELRPDMPQALDRVVLKGLERDRRRRHASLEELRDTLQQLVPEDQVPARTRMLVAAYLIDTIFTAFLVQMPVEFLQWLLGFRQWLAAADVPVDPFAIVAYVLYFAVCEGFIGATVGKWLLGLRVVPHGSVGPPGFGIATLRSAIFLTGWMLIWLGFLCMAEIRDFGLPCGLMLIFGGIAFLAYRRRRPDSNRGPHDLLTGTHVVQCRRRPHRVRLISKAPNRLERSATVPGLPASVGGYSVRGRCVHKGDGSQVWLADDRSLGRRVLLHLFPAAIETVMPPSRPTRLRVLSSGELEWDGRSWTWHAYAAPAGAPLADLITPNQPLNWPDARLLLEQLVEELRAAEADATLPGFLGINEIWSEPSGRIFLLDFPMPSRLPSKSALEPLDLVREATTLLLEGKPRAKGGPVEAPLPPRASAVVNRLFDDDNLYTDLEELQCELAESHAHEPTVTRKLRTTHLGISTMLLALPILAMFIYTAMIESIVAIEVWDNLVVTRAVLRSLDQPTSIQTLRQNPDFDAALSAGRLPETRARLHKLTIKREEDFAAELSYLSKAERYLLGRSRFREPETGTDPSPWNADVADLILDRGSPELDTPVGIWRPLLMVLSLFVCVAVLTVLVACAMLFRGGIAHGLAGIALVRRTGKPAGRFRCGVREVALWLPLILILLASAYLQLQWPAWFFGRSIVIACAIALLIGYAALGFRHPEQGPLDRLFGTHRVPI